MRRTQRFVFTVWMKIKRRECVCVCRLCVMTVWWLCPASHYQRKRHAVQKVKKMIHLTSADSRQTKKLWSIFKVTANEEIIHGASVCTRGENESCWRKRSTFLGTCWFYFWCFTAKPHKTTNFVFGTDSKETRAQHRLVHIWYQHLSWVIRSQEDVLSSGVNGPKDTLNWRASSCDRIAQSGCEHLHRVPASVGVGLSVHSGSVNPSDLQLWAWGPIVDGTTEAHSENRNRSSD